MDKKKEFLNKVYNTIVKETIIDKKNNIISFPWYNIRLDQLWVFFEGPNIWRDKEPHSIYYPFLNHCVDIYGLTDSETYSLWYNYKNFLRDIIENGEYLKLMRINENVDKQKEYLDKVVKHMLQRFRDSADNKFQRVDMKSFTDFGESFGLTDLELNYVYHKYFYLKGWNKKDISSWYLDNNINESVDKQKQFLYKVVDQLVNETDIDLVNNRIRYPYGGLNTTCDGVVVDTPFIVSHLINVYGLDKKEIDEVISMYTQFIKRKIKFGLKGGRINESVDKQKEYLSYVYNDLIKNTKFRDNESIEIDVYDGKCKSLQAGIRWGSVAPYFNFISECLEDFLKNTYGLTYDEIQELFWDRYDEHIINMVLTRKERISPHVRVHVDYLRESKEDKQTEFLKYVVDTMIDETKPFNETGASVITPFIADRGWYSLGGDMFVLSAHYCKRMVENFDDEFTMGKLFTNYLSMFGITEIDEIEEVMYWYFNDIYEKYFKRFFDLSYKTRPRLDESVDYLRESKIDKQTEFLKKVVDKMMRDTKEYGFIKNVLHVITPFIAYPGKYVLSANHCKNMVDYFDDKFRLGKIFNDYLDVFGLSYEEMEEVMYWYFNEVYEKYFKRFYDDSYKTRPRLDEGIDLGFVDKVVDSVLKEIVWDFDRGIVYFPMIDYSASIRDDYFLSAVNADDPFSNRFSERYETTWHNDLMDYIVKTYGITDNEWNRVWGSLQGEIWEKTEKYWDSFPEGY